MRASGGRWWLIATAALLAAAPGCGGCGSKSEYPPNLTFPPRTDRLVLKLPDKPAPAMNTAGKRDEEIAALDSLGGRTVDPATFPANLDDPADPRSALDIFLGATFRTPADPGDVSGPLKLTKAHLAEGSKLFKRHCLD
ncbi:MAG: hypothetical protein J0I06_23470, partial [Planctomycetes bacterium]|nr:hypothetical protein [Planctomycetota bacterium]